MMTTETTITINELLAIMSAANEVSQLYNLKEVCSEALLYALLSKPEFTAYVSLVDAGCNMAVFKRHLIKSLKAKGSAGSATKGNLPVSIAVEGLMALNAIAYGNTDTTSFQLLKTIIRNDNTAAARLLKAKRITLNQKNELIYKTLNN